MNTKQLIAKLQKSLDKNGNLEVLVLDTNGRVQNFNDIAPEYVDEEAYVADEDYAKENDLKPKDRCLVICHDNT
jgi:hypothetical protein